MRIAIISPSQNAYSETFIQEQKEGLHGEIFYYYGGTLPTLLENKGKLLSRTNAFFFKIKQELKFTSFKPAEQAFIHSLKKHKIQVILAQYGPTAHRIVSICKELNIPLITHFHGYDTSVYSVIKECDNYKEVFLYSNYVIAVSLKMQQKLVELGCEKEKVIYNPCAPNPIFFDIKPSFEKPTFLALGRFVDKKAPYYTILAFNKILNKFPNAKLIIGGKGELYEVCKNLVGFLKIDDKVLLPGIMSRANFINYLQDSLAFVQHSIKAESGDEEGTPVAIMEASAAGLPIIATRHAGIPDVIIEQKTGLLVNEHDVEMMAQKMLLLLQDNKLARDLGIKGKEHIKNNFSMKNHLDTLDNLIKKATKN